MLGAGQRFVGSVLRRFGLVSAQSLRTFRPVLAKLDGASGLLPTSGFTMPSLEGARIFPMSPTRPGNWIVVCRGGSLATRTKFAVREGATGNIVVFGNTNRRPKSIEIHGSNNVGVFGDAITWPLELSLRMSSSNGVSFFGSACSSNGTVAILEGDGKHLLVGDDCMFAADTEVRTSDLHGIADRATGDWLNPPNDVLIEQHVWIGLGALIAKGAHIKSGSVVGARALVTGTISADSIAAGIPAKVIRRDIQWTRERSPLPIP